MSPTTRTTLSNPLRPLIVRARPLVARTTIRFSATSTRVQPVLRSVTALGWVVLGLWIVGWITGGILGWSELLYISATSFVVLVIGLGFVLRPLTLDAEVILDARRVSAGVSCGGVVRSRNRGSRRSQGASLDLRIGDKVLGVQVPSLEAGGSVEELFVIRTERRGIISIGPSRIIRQDPVGVFSRNAIVGQEEELIVHPVITHLDSFGSGLLRDLEGLTSDEISQSDLAFHSMREYEAGDDRRHIHWRSTAKTGELYVKQFFDTRRSNLLVVVDPRPENYESEIEYEIAVEVAGSLTVGAVQGDIFAVLAAGRFAATGIVAHEFLDALARAEMEESGPSLSQLVVRAARADTTLAILISGSLAQPALFQRAASRLSPEVRVSAVRVSPSERPNLSVTDRLTLIQLRAAKDLRPVISSGVMA